MLNDGIIEWSNHRMQRSRYEILPTLAAHDVLEQLRGAASELPFDVRPDSVDGAPAHELYVIKDGAVQHEALAELVRPILGDLRNHVGRWPICAREAAGCVPCTVLMRRYRPQERRAHYEHVDGHAAATAVISLSHREHYRGGLFLSNLTLRTLLPLDAGDAVLHASDLFHGVHVTEGERWSLVVWFLTCPHCTMAGSSGWYRERAEAGEPFGTFLHASRVSQAIRTPRERHAKAAYWYNLSAVAGFAPAMHRLGNAYATGEGVPADLRLAASWLERAIASGTGGDLGLRVQGAETVLAGGPSVGARAAFDLARLLLRGVENGWPSPLPTAAAAPSERATVLLAMSAAEGHVRAQEWLDARATLAARPEAHADQQALAQLQQVGQGEARITIGNNCDSGGSARRTVAVPEADSTGSLGCRQLQEQMAPQRRAATFEDVATACLLAVAALVAAAIAVRRRMAKGGGGAAALGARMLLRAKRVDESACEPRAVM